jgi:DNA-3-methyladenine glycosylase
MTSLAKATILPSAFFNRDPRRVARALLGKLLVRTTPSGILAGRIVETEAYLGKDDAAAHSASGKTARNAVLFGPPGHAYVYFIYGNYYCLNVSCLPDGVPGGVLFRALEPIEGIEKMARARGVDLQALESRLVELRKAGDRKTISCLRTISSGPGRMAEALSVTRARDNDKSFVSIRSDLRIVDDGYRVRSVIAGPRVGITKSAEQVLRYLIANNPFVSATVPSFKD